ncbi:MAG: hypothetical protein H7832_01210 [Magnetococcus sp. DMHC-6]
MMNFQQNSGSNSDDLNNNLLPKFSLEILPDAPAESASTRLSSEEQWRQDRQAVILFSQNGQWEEALNRLKTLSTKYRNHHLYSALAQRVWVALKWQVPASEAVLALFHLLNTLGAKHELAGPLAALAHLLAKHRTPNHPDRELALGQAQQMFSLICHHQLIESDEAFQAWVQENQLDQPDFYIPQIMNGLEVMVGEDWWIDREALQKSLEHDAIREKN